MFNIREKVKGLIREVIHEDYGESFPITYERVSEEALTDQDKANIKAALRDLDAGDYSGPFHTHSELRVHLDSLKK